MPVWRTSPRNPFLSKAESEPQNAPVFHQALPALWKTGAFFFFSSGPWCGWQTRLRPPTTPAARRHIQQPLVAAAAEAQGDVVLCLHEFTVHQHIQQLQQLIGHLAPGGAGLFAGELLPGVAGVAPDRFVGVQGLEVAHKGQQLPLVFRLKGLAAQQGQPGNVVRLAGGEHLIAGGLVKGLAVGKIPGHGVEAAGAAVAAAGNKYAGAHAGPVGNVVILDGCVVHSDTPIKSSPSRGSWQCEALTERVTDAARGP